MTIKSGIAGRLGCQPLRDERGTVVLKFALMVPALLAIMGAAVDLGVVNQQKVRLQAAADAGSIAAAKELGLSDFKGDNVNSIVQAVVDAYMSTNKAVADGKVSVEALIRENPLEVEVSAKQELASFFGKSFSLGAEHVTVRSVARVVGRPNICVLGLDPDQAGTISLEQRALVTGLNCAVFSNSGHNLSIKSKNSATLKANLICSRGGKDGGSANFTPDPITDCPGFDDPLADRPEPVAGSCLENDLKVSMKTMTLEPGTYCGGIEISDMSKVTLKPGVYIIKDGPLIVDTRSSLTGDGVGFFLTGKDANFEFDVESSIDLSAPEEGPLAGLLMFEGRSQPVKKNIHRISSDDARRLIGTIYLSRGELRVDADSPVADQSAYTAIVARTIRLYGGPHLVLNTNYSLTPVPVPAGIRGADQPVSLVK